MVYGFCAQSAGLKTETELQRGTVEEEMLNLWKPGSKERKKMLEREIPSKGTLPVTAFHSQPLLLSVYLVINSSMDQCTAENSTP